MYLVVLFALFIGFCASVSAASAPAAPAHTPKSLLAQAKGLPAEFESHFFEVPLAVRVELDGRFLGEALVVLSRDDQVTLLEFTDIGASTVDAQARERWAAFLKQGASLSGCTQACPAPLLAVHYSLANSVLSILTRAVESSSDLPSFHAIPSGGSTGLIVRNQLNINGGEQQDATGRYGLEATASLGQWTPHLNMQLARFDGADSQLYHAIQELYAQRELQGHFLRLGYFTPAYEGLSRQPRAFGSSPETALGVMFGSSDSLAIDNPQPSVYPIYVTASRQASVEVYRDGLLINTQLVEAGLRALDTRTLPGGIYNVEVRLVEDGQVTSTTQELVYKPGNWRNTDERWRYNLFAGREAQLWNNWEHQHGNDMTAGVAVNYLLHPRLIVGASTRVIDDNFQYGSSLDWTLTDSASAYFNLYRTDAYGTGMDLQGIYGYTSGSVVASHARSWLDTRGTYDTLPDGTRVRTRNTFVGQASTTSLSLNHRLDRSHSLTARVGYSEGYTQGAAFDLGWLYRGSLLDSPADWRLSLFDRPGSVSSGERRDRGVDLSLNLTFGSSGRSLTGSVGNRTSREGGRDTVTSLTYRQDMHDYYLQNVSATVLHDTYGVGLSGTVNFEADTVGGDAFIQRSSFNDRVSGGLNLENTVAVGARKVAVTSQRQGREAGMIIDLDSDLDGVVLRADGVNGSNTTLRPGRNFVPITAYQSSSLSFDFEGRSVPAGAIQPAQTSYHLNKGGVGYRQVRVMQTVTVLGRLLDVDGEPLRGHHLINLVSRGVSEADGFFSMEMSLGEPLLDVRYGNRLLCSITIDPDRGKRQQDVLLVGDVRCPSN